jgi:2-polyprenyl-3-methyl-5-hydroxy-6-metoxy-1,4-benzoquinol methylase
MSLDLSQRRLEAELMDQPGLDADVHRQALRGLQRINWFSRSAAIVWPQIRAVAQTARPCRVLDIASGGGDVAIAIARRCRTWNPPIEVLGVDMSGTAVEHARQNALRAGVANVLFQQLDVFENSLPADYDVVMCSLFLHHLSNEQAVELLRKMAAATRRLVLVNDLRRTRLGYALAWWGGRLLTRSPIVHVDGPMSVVAAFTCDEALALAEQAGLAKAKIVLRWPQRYLLSWSKP